MQNISMLRALVQNGWTRNTRQLFEQRLGKEQFDILKQAYVKFADGAPFFPKATTKGKDICLSFGIPLEEANCPFDFSELPTIFRAKFKDGVQKFLDSIFPKFKNEEINIVNICNKFKQFDFDKVGSKKALFDAMGVNYKEESYKISDLIKLKHIGNTATLQKDSSFTSEIVRDKKSFFDTIGKLFSKSKDEIITSEQICSDNVINYAIKENGKIIGYFSTETKEGALNVGNYVLFPQYRGTKTSMNAILTVRDRVIKIAEQSGVKVIKADVDASNPQLLGLYKRFGFQENGREIISFTDELGKIQTSDTYNLIGYLG